MPKTRLVVTASVLAASAYAAWLWYSPGPSRETVQDASDAEATASLMAAEEMANGSPFAVAPVSKANEPGVAVTRTNVVTADRLSDVELPYLDVSQLGRSPISDTEFELLVARLRNEPVLLKQLVDEFRQEQNPERRSLLARLLGEAGGAEVTQIASELIFSGNEASRELGLKVLSRVQPGDPQARDIASSLLTTEVEPRVLQSTLNALASPGVVDTDSRALLSDQVALLASHEDAGVRGISLSVLSRWSTDGRDTPVLINALLDPEPRVRESAAYALVGHEDTSGAVVQSLFTVLRNGGEQKATRRAALLALRSLSLNDEQRGELPDLERELNTVRR